MSSITHNATETEEIIAASRRNYEGDFEMTTMQEAFGKWSEGDSFNESGVAYDAFEAGYQAAITALKERITFLERTNAEQAKMLNEVIAERNEFREALENSAHIGPRSTK